MWEILDEKIWENKLKTREDLKTALLEEWDAILASETAKGVNRMQRIFKAIIRAKGYPKNIESSLL